MSGHFSEPPPDPYNGNGECKVCAGQVDPYEGGDICPDCVEQKEMERAHREWKKGKQSEDGLCPDCGGALDQNLTCRGECLMEKADVMHDAWKVWRARLRE